MVGFPKVEVGAVYAAQSSSPRLITTALPFFPPVHESNHRNSTQLLFGQPSDRRNNRYRRGRPDCSEVGSHARMKSIVLHQQHFPTFGNEVCVTASLRQRQGQRTFTGVLRHTNSDGESEVLLTRRVRNSRELWRFLDEAENLGFALEYNLTLMAKAEGLAPEFVECLASERTSEMRRDRQIGGRPRLYTPAGFIRAWSGRLIEISGSAETPSRST